MPDALIFLFHRNHRMKKIQKFFQKIFVTNADNQVWMASSVVLILLCVLFGAYTFHPGFHSSVDALLWGTQQAAPTQQKLFHLPVTVVYDPSSTEQKAKMDEFLQNLTDPTQALIDTDLQTTWLDSKDPKAQPLMALSGLHYLPQIFIDQSIEQHPQFQALQSYLNKSGDTYFIRLSPLEHLQIPSTDGGHVEGVDPSQAKVVIQDYESYSCDHCAEAQDTLKKLLKDYPKTLRVVYKHFEPGDTYNQIAQGAECAADQNKFFEMQDRIFKGQPDMLQKLQTMTSAADSSNYVSSLLEGYAKDLKLNASVFKTCLDEAYHSKDIEDQTLEAVDYGVNGPPTFFINDKFQSGLLTYDEFKTIIDQDLAQS